MSFRKEKKNNIITFALIYNSSKNFTFVELKFKQKNTIHHEQFNG